MAGRIQICLVRRIYLSFFRDTHKYICVAWWTFCAHGAAFNLQIILTVENEFIYVKTKWRNVEIIVICIFFSFQGCFRSCNSFLFAIFVCGEHTSMVARMLLSSFFSMLMIFSMKSTESLIDDLSYFTRGCNWWSMYF